MPRTINRVDRGSRLLAVPKIQGVNKDMTQNFTKQVKDVYKVERMGNDWKEKLVNTAVLVAATVAGLVIGGKLLALGGSSLVIASGAALVSFAGILGFYSIYSSVKTAIKILNQDALKAVHDDATKLRIEDIILDAQEEQEEQEELIERRRTRGVTPLHGRLHGGASAASSGPVGAFRL